jgi:RNA polymerase sigma factor (sigma-70 family)
MSDIALPITGVPSLPHARRLLSDERLAKLAGRGDARAFATLYERNHQAIYRYCQSIVRHDQDAQDALQNTMMRAYAALRAQERDLAVRPWLFRIAHNEAISILRRRRSVAELDERQEHPSWPVDSEVESRERFSTLVSDLRSLPERQRGALLMRELNGLSIEEIAQALAISQGAAKQTIFEARSSLHELAEGRAMPCEAVREAISARDGRVLRARRMRAHLRACAECRSFKEAIGTRSAELHALSPALPAPAAGAMLARLLAGGGGHGSGSSLAGASLGGTLSGQGTLLGGHAAGSLLVKGLAGVAIAAVAAAGATRLAATSHRDGHQAGASSTSRAPAAPSGSLTSISRSTTAKTRRSRGADASSLAGNGSASSTSGRLGAPGSIGALLTSSTAANRGLAQSSTTAPGHAGGHAGTGGHGGAQGGQRSGSRRHSSGRHGAPGAGGAHRQGNAHGTGARHPGAGHSERHGGSEHGSSTAGSQVQTPTSPAGESGGRTSGASEGHSGQASQGSGAREASRADEARDTTTGSPPSALPAGAATR